MSKTIVYLDQNKWVQLAREIYGGRGDQLSSELLSLKERGSIVIPLGYAHYMETWHRSDWESRWNLASVMHLFSDFTTIASGDAMRSAEAEALVAKRARTGTFIPRPEVGFIGYGVDHAFRSEYGRFVPVAEDYDPGDPYPQVTSPAAFFTDDLKKIGRWWYEWLSLAWLPDAWEEEKKLSFNPAPQHGRGDHFVQRWTAVADHAKKMGRGKIRRSDLLIYFFMHYLEGLLIEKCAPYQLLPMSVRKSVGELEDFLEEMPTAYCEFSLWEARMKNQQKGWEQHDLTDIQALGSAIAYCDIVVTEKQWKHIAERAGLASRFNTKIFHNLSEAVDFIKSA